MITDNTITRDFGRARGWIFYDAECPMCVLGQSRVGKFFEKRDWIWIPLQTPGTPKRLNCAEIEILKEMKVQLNSGKVIGGVAAWAALFRSVWWLSPLGVLLTWPIIRQLADLGYGWVARNRYCWSGAGRIRKENPL